MLHVATALILCKKVTYVSCFSSLLLFLHPGLVSKSQSQVEKNSEGKPVSHARDYERQDDALPPRHAAPCLGTSSQCLHASPHHDSCNVCSKPLPQQFCPDDTKVCRHATVACSVHRKTSLRSSSPNSQSHANSNISRRTLSISLGAVGCIWTEPVHLSQPNSHESTSPYECVMYAIVSWNDPCELHANTCCSGTRESMVIRNNNFF